MNTENKLEVPSVTIQETTKLREWLGWFGSTAWMLLVNMGYQMFVLDWSNKFDRWYPVIFMLLTALSIAAFGFLFGRTPDRLSKIAFAALRNIVTTSSRAAESHGREPSVMPEAIPHAHASTVHSDGSEGFTSPNITPAWISAISMRFASSSRNASSVALSRKPFSMRNTCGHPTATAERITPR